jgi:archaellum component FlaC
VSRLTLTEAEIERLRAAVMSAEEAAERAKSVASTVETVARDATQAAAREKAALEAKVSELESDLCTATMDLAMASRQFS